MRCLHLPFRIQSKEFVTMCEAESRKQIGRRAIGFRGCNKIPASLILRRFFDVSDDDNFDWPFSAFQFQSELLGCVNHAGVIIVIG
jgi:hypothetical protein